LNELTKKLLHATVILNTAIKTYKPKHIFGLFSGGHDSATVTHFANQALGDQITGVVHINTGIGIPQTREYVRDTSKHFGWNLMEYKATENVNAKGEPDPMVYEALVTKLGFPGAFGHGMMYNRLKERQLRRLARDFEATPKEPVMLISGCRKEESTRRMGTTKEIDKQGRFLWVAPFAEMTGIDLGYYMEFEDIPRNQVKDLLHMSGECLCGAFAHKGELAEIDMWFPEVAEGIRAIEKRVRDAGFPWGWEEQPPSWWTDRKKAKASGQEDAFEAEANAEIEYLCMGCHARDEVDPTPWCHVCGAMEQSNCDCLPYAENH
jgi:3'-phosphoadenosine 5'-phosphosulfate sulfotransferase (PAPS reductase)/FAD synthetase